MKRKLALLIVLASLMIASNVLALEKKPLSQIDVNSLLSETQLNMPAGDSHLALAWWIPVEYWEASLGGEQATEENRAMIETLRPFFLLGVVQADVSQMGAFKFYEIGEVSSNMTIAYKDAEGKTHTLKQEEKLDEDVNMLLQVLKPILGSAMGQLGNNFHFFVYTDTAAKDGRVVDPYGNGSMIINLKSRDGASMSSAVQFPLDSLYIPRLCPNGNPAHVSWSYCPWSGKKLNK